LVTREWCNPPKSCF